MLLKIGRARDEEEVLCNKFGISYKDYFMSESSESKYQVVGLGGVYTNSVGDNGSFPLQFLYFRLVSLCIFSLKCVTYRV
jgi:hypothetical protein